MTSASFESDPLLSAAGRAGGANAMYGARTSRFPAGFIILRIVISLFLLTAAAFKTYGLWGDQASPPLPVLSSPRLQVALIEAEVILAVWLLSGAYLLGAWVAALVTFSHLAAASLYLSLVGWASCACFGQLAINPWYTFCADVVVLAALLLWRPRRAHRVVAASVRATRAHTRMYFALGSAAFVAICLLALHWLGWPSSDMLALLRGDSLTIEPSIADIGDVPLGEERVFAIRIRNHTDQAIRIIGGSCDRSCAVTEDLPTLVPAREDRSLRVRFRSGASRGYVRNQYVLFTDDPGQGAITGGFRGYVFGAEEND